MSGLPHLSVAPVRVAGRVGTLAIGDLHLVTGYVELASFTRMLIEESGVQPLRDDWRDLLVTGNGPPLPE